MRIFFENGISLNAWLFKLQTLIKVPINIKDLSLCLIFCGGALRDRLRFPVFLSKKWETSNRLLQISPQALYLGIKIIYPRAEIWNPTREIILKNYYSNFYSTVTGRLQIPPRCPLFAWNFTLTGSPVSVIKPGPAGLPAPPSFSPNALK